MKISQENQASRSDLTHIESVRDAFTRAGQEQVFRFWDSLTSAERRNLIDQASEVHLEELEELVGNLVVGGPISGLEAAVLEPAPYIGQPGSAEEKQNWMAASRLGEEAIRSARVAAFTVAGGQGTRLGFSGPKGTYRITPVKQKSLFQVFAEGIRASSTRYGVRIPWFVMTSESNHDETVDFFEKNGYFGLSADDLYFFPQGRMPAVDFKGKILMEAPDTISMSPEGHGGSLRALVGSGAVDTMNQRGIDLISYFQVDNPLIRPIDPAFIGFHLQADSEMSSKMVAKAYPDERVGVFCLRDGGITVVEYSDLPNALAHARDEAGNLRYRSGSIAIHLLSAQFVERMGGGRDTVERLPYHRANKKVMVCDELGNSVIPEEPNGIKFETFMFDALPFAKNPVVMETQRKGEFSPLKNTSGVDSPKTCCEDQIRRWAGWLIAAGEPLETDASGVPPIRIEVSPLFADDEGAFVDKWNSLSSKPEIRQGTYLE